jgi:hypothetical protein
MMCATQFMLALVVLVVVVVGIENSARGFCQRRNPRPYPVQAMSGSSDVEASGGAN